MVLVINPIISLFILFALLVPLKDNESIKPISPRFYKNITILYKSLITLNTCNLFLYTVIFCILSQVQKDVPKSKTVRTLKKEGTSSVYVAAKQSTRFRLYNWLIIFLNVCLFTVYMYLWIYKGLFKRFEKQSVQNSENLSPKPPKDVDPKPPKDVDPKPPGDEPVIDINQNNQEQKEHTTHVDQKVETLLEKIDADEIDEYIGAAELDKQHKVGATRIEQQTKSEKGEDTSELTKVDSAKAHQSEDEIMKKARKISASMREAANQSIDDILERARKITAERIEAARQSIDKMSKVTDLERRMKLEQDFKKADKLLEDVKAVRQASSTVTKETRQKSNILEQARRKHKEKMYELAQIGQKAKAMVQSSKKTAERFMQVQRRGLKQSAQNRKTKERLDELAQMRQDARVKRQEERLDELAKREGEKVERLLQEHDDLLDRVEQEHDDLLDRLDDIDLSELDSD